MKKITKSLLLGAVLSSTALCTTTSYANTQFIGYTGNNNFTFQGTTYTGLSQVLNANFDAIFNGNIDIDMTFNDAQTYATDLKNRNAAVTGDLTTILEGAANLAGHPISKGDAGTITELILEDLDDTDLNNQTALQEFFGTFETIFEEPDLFDDVLNYIQDTISEKEGVNITNDAQKEYTDRIANQVSNNLGSNATIQQKKEERKKIVEKERTKDTTQEALKEILDNIENLKKQVGKDAEQSKQIAKALELEKSKLKNTLERYINKDSNADREKLAAIQKREIGSVASIAITGNRVIESNIRERGFAANTGISSGDILDSQGVWIKGIYTTATKGNEAKVEGYKFTSSGATIGYEIGDDKMLGIAFSYMVSDLKGKVTSSNKNDYTTYAGTLYGKVDITNEFFVSAQGSIGKTDIKKDRNSGDKAKTIIKSKTKSDSISGRLEVGYDYKVNQKVHVVPTTGFSFIDVKIDKYKEEGSGLTRSIAKRKVGKNSFLVGVSTFYVSELNNNTKIIPELHVNLDQAISTKNSDTVLTISEDIAPITVTAEKLPKTYYNIGTSVKSVFKDNIEVSLGYDLDMAKKFTSHTGNLKLKINF